MLKIKLSCKFMHFRLVMKTHFTTVLVAAHLMLTTILLKWSPMSKLFSALILLEQKYKLRYYKKLSLILFSIVQINFLS